MFWTVRNVPPSIVTTIQASDEDADQREVDRRRRRVARSRCAAFCRQVARRRVVVADVVSETLTPPPPARRPAARAMISVLGGARGQLAGDAAVAHHEDAVAHADQLGQLGRDHQDRHAVAREPAHEVVDAGLGADVDAAGRLVEDQDAAAAIASHLASTTFCWLPPDRKRTSCSSERARSSTERASSCTLTVPGSRRRCLPPSDRSASSALSRIGWREREALGLAVLGDEADARP